MQFFVIFVVHQGVTKFSTHKIYSTLQCCPLVFKFEPFFFFIALFRYLCPIDSTVDPQGALSRAVPRDG